MLEAASLVKGKKKILNSPTSQRESWSAAVHFILSGEVVNNSLRTVQNFPDRCLAPISGGVLYAEADLDQYATMILRTTT